MTESPNRIVVAGDITVDWFTRPVPAGDSGENWRLHPAMHSSASPGGAALLASFIEHALGPARGEIEVLSPLLPPDLAAVAPREIIHANAMLAEFPRQKGAREKVLRVKAPHGYMGPRTGLPSPLKVVADPAEASVIVLDDAGNVFRDTPDAWPRALGKDHPGIVVYKMSRPLSSGRLWSHLSELALEKLVVVVNAGDLRSTLGVNISEGLSWERTAKEFMFQIHRAPELQSLQRIPYLVVIFGYDGGILHRGREGGAATLIFDPKSLEGDFSASVEGSMHGRGAAVTATVVSRLAQRGLGGLESAIAEGLARSRQLLQTGYVEGPDGAIRIPMEKVFHGDTEARRFVSCSVEPPVSFHDPDPNYWRMLDQKTRNSRRRVAIELVTRAERATGLEGVPVGAFGQVATIDRAEIESYSGIRQLIVQFLEASAPKRPLCFSVFGPPGSGKSFGVKQVMKSIGTSQLTSLTFNVSQFSDYSDLVAALHKVRDEVLTGRVPFVFFDEFDSALGDQALGWLKYFLAPMQDGEFKDGEAIHPIGKTILVFAGGTRSSFQAFVSNLPDEGSTEGLIPLSDERPDGDALPEDRRREFKEAFRRAKGPDFVSRLRGFINIMGPNRQPTAGDDDEPFVIRRAKVLQFMLRGRAADLFGSSGCRIDQNVLRALLGVSRYRHGARSMEAILDMSRLTGARRFDLSALPPREQLEIHVDASEFLFLAEKERYLSLVSQRDLPRPGDLAFTDPPVALTRPGWFQHMESGFVHAVARRLHEQYLRVRRLGEHDLARHEAFEELPEGFRISNLDAAEHVPIKLRAIGHGMRRIPPGRPPRTPDISDEEVELLARLEHERFCSERRTQGWRLGPVTDPAARTTPYLVDFDSLPDEVKNFNYQTVMGIPLILKDLGYEVFREVDVDELHDMELVENLARVIHGDYVQRRIAEGETPESNPSMVPFDQLPQDLKDANRDNARTIPRKLAHVGFFVRRKRNTDAGGPVSFVTKEMEPIVEKMSIMEHARWNWQKILQGWVFKPGRKDVANKTTPFLVPWKLLDPGIRELDRDTVRLIPVLLDQAGYTICHDGVKP